MIKTILSSITVILFVFFFAATSSLWIKTKMLQRKLIQAEIDKEVILEYFGNKPVADAKAEVEIKDDFIKFLSDSRDWAFEYIEKVQEGLQAFIDDVKPEMNHFDKFGIIASADPLYTSMKKVSEAYKSLESLLPSDHGKIDE